MSRRHDLHYEVRSSILLAFHCLISPFLLPIKTCRFAISVFTDWWRWCRVTCSNEYTTLFKYEPYSPGVRVEVLTFIVGRLYMYCMEIIFILFITYGHVTDLHVNAYFYIPTSNTLWFCMEFLVDFLNISLSFHLHSLNNYFIYLIQCIPHMSL